MKIYTLCLLLAASAFLAGNALAGVEMASSSQLPPKAVVVTTPVLSESGGCGCSTPVKPIHFINGIPSNGPVTGDPAYADPEGDGCGCAQAFGFRDYGPTRHVPPVEPKDMKPSS